MYEYQNFEERPPPPSPPAMFATPVGNPDATGLYIPPENIRKTLVAWNGLLDQAMASVSRIG